MAYVLSKASLAVVRQIFAEKKRSEMRINHQGNAENCLQDFPSKIYFIKKYKSLIFVSLSGTVTKKNKIYFNSTILV